MEQPAETPVPPAGQPDSAREHDLGALLARLFPVLIDLETPILAAAELSMWEYAILTELVAQPSVSQAELAQRTGRDPTRLGAHLKDLHARSLITRERGTDHRRHTIHATPTGIRLQARTQAQIRSAENTLLTHSLGDTGAAQLRSLLTNLATTPAPQRPSPDHP